MNQKMLNWEDAISTIDLVEYFNYKFPNFYYDQSRKAYVDNSNPQLRSDKFVFFKGKDGKQNYLSRHSGLGGNLINFIANHIVNNNNNKWEAVNQELQTFDQLLPAVKNEIKNKVSLNIKEELFNNEITDKFQLTGKFYPLHANQLNYITKEREIIASVVNSPTFKDVAKSYVSQNSNNFVIGVPLIDENKNVVGVFKNNTQTNYANAIPKSFEKGSQNQIGFSKSNDILNSKSFTLTESIWDAMAHFQLKRPDNSEYIFTNGELAQNKINSILNYAEKRGISKFNLAHDNDARGHYFDLMFINQVSPGIKMNNFGNKYISIAFKIDDNVNLKKLEKMLLLMNQLDKNTLQYIQSNFNKTDAMQLIKDTNALSYFLKNENSYQFILPNEGKYISEFNQFSLEIFNNVKKDISIEKSISKDFNDDLKLMNSKKLFPSLKQDNPGPKNKLKL